MGIWVNWGNYQGYMGIMDKNMETTVMGYIGSGGLGFRGVYGAACYVMSGYVTWNPRTPLRTSMDKFAQLVPLWLEGPGR